MRAPCWMRSATARRAQLQVVTRDKPDYPEAWLVQGTLQLQDNQVAAAEASLKRYIDLAQQAGLRRGTQPRLGPGLFVAVALAEKRKDYAWRSWLDKIENSAGAGGRAASPRLHPGRARASSEEAAS